MNYIAGDLIRDSKNYDVLVHGCNCFNRMGAGIAKGIKINFPEAFNADANDPRKPIDRLGGITYTKALSSSLIIVNAYTQYHFAGPKNVEYLAIRMALREIKKTFTGKKIAMPLIGAGLAGGHWETIEQLIKDELNGEDVTVVIWEEDIKKQQAAKAAKQAQPTTNILTQDDNTKKSPVQPTTKTTFQNLNTSKNSDDILNDLIDEFDLGD